MAVPLSSCVDALRRLVLLLSRRRWYAQRSFLPDLWCEGTIESWKLLCEGGCD